MQQLDCVDCVALMYDKTQKQFFIILDVKGSDLAGDSIVWRALGVVEIINGWKEHVGGFFVQQRV